MKCSSSCLIWNRITSYNVCYTKLLRFLAVLRDTLAGPPGASDLLLPRVDLSRLFPEPAAAYVQARGGQVHLRITSYNVCYTKLLRRYTVVIGS